MHISKLLTMTGCGATVIHHQDCKSNADECYRFISNMALQILHGTFTQSPTVYLCFRSFLLSFLRITNY